MFYVDLNLKKLGASLASPFLCKLRSRDITLKIDYVFLAKYLEMKKIIRPGVDSTKKPFFAQSQWIKYNNVQYFSP